MCALGIISNSVLFQYWFYCPTIAKTDDRFLKFSLDNRKMFDKRQKFIWTDLIHGELIRRCSWGPFQYIWKGLCQARVRLKTQHVDSIITRVQSSFSGNAFFLRTKFYGFGESATSSVDVCHYLNPYKTRWKKKPKVATLETHLNVGALERLPEQTHAAHGSLIW